MNDRSSLGVKPDSFYSERMSKLNTPSGDSLVSGGFTHFWWHIPQMRYIFGSVSSHMFHRIGPISG